MATNADDSDLTFKDDINTENIGLGCALEMFSEIEEVITLIENLKTVYKAQLSIVERAYERYLYILDQYHEQPHLLDPHLDALLHLLITIIRAPDSDMNLKHEAFKYMYVLIKVRGYKVVVRHLPHEIADFEPVLQCLEEQNPNDTDHWTTRYDLLLWLSIIVKIPFHMSRLDASHGEGDSTVMSRLYDICKIYVIVGDKCRDAAAYLAAQYLTRIDVKDTHLCPFLDWTCDVVNNPTSNNFMRHGALATIAMILKYGKREDLLPYAGKLLSWLINTNYKETSGTSVPKMGFKIVQRIGLTYLRPQLASWRYQRGSRILAANLSAGDNTKLTDVNAMCSETDDDDDRDVPSEIEDVIDELIQGLRSADGVVRWTCAKGIGRVTGRLPKDLADDVVGSLLELFSVREGNEAWHGGCLTLAELGRRGLLLPQRLPDVVPVVIKALTYDELRGYTSVGAHIRDAACYVCWAFARAYAIEDLRPYVPSLARALLIVAVFDREVNCRRAASAAFQENVGRQGSFPHGIDILTVADFFAVGIRTNAYLSLSVYIAQFNEYRNALIDHLVERKVDHWDIAIRELTARALHNLTATNPHYMSSQVLDTLFTKSESIDLNARHGSILAIGEIVYSLYKIPDNESTKRVYLKESTRRQIERLVSDYRSRMLFRGLGGELMKQACSRFIQKCSLAKFPVHNSTVLEDWLNLLNECLSYEVATVRTTAIESLPSFFNEYYGSRNQQETRNAVLDNYLKQLYENNKITRMGYSLAIGSLPSFMLCFKLDKIIESILSVTKITDQTIKWAECRRDALKALTQICETVTVDIDIAENNIKLIYEAFLNGLNEYTQDNRGDIGAWVREAAMSGIQSLTILLAKSNPDLLTPELVCKLMTGLSQQAVEKIDRTRALAGRIFSSLIHNDPLVPHIPNHSELQIIFPATDCDLINWNSEAVTFPKFVRLLGYEDYMHNIMLGLIVSIGGLTETLVKTSSASFFAYLDTLKDCKTEIHRICDVILDIFIKYQKIDRIIVPIFRFLEKLMGSGRIQTILDDEQSKFVLQILKLLQVEMTNCRDIYKLIDGIGALCQFIQVSRSEGTSALVQLSIFLCHRHSYVRKTTATRIYESLLVYGDTSIIPVDKLDDIMAIIVETNWDKPVEELRPIRNQLCELMGIRVPIMRSKKN